MPPATDAKNSQRMILIGSAAGGGLLLIAGVLLIVMGTGKPGGDAAAQAKTQPTPANVAPDTPRATGSPLSRDGDGLKGSIPLPKTSSAHDSSPAKKTEPESDPASKRGLLGAIAPDDGNSSDTFRAGYALRLLDEAKKYGKEHPEDPSALRNRLKMVATNYDSFPAGKEAAKVIAEMQAPADGWPEGFVWREYWLNIGGDQVANLTRSPNFPSKPSGREKRPDFAGPVDVADNYGARIRGYVHPPLDGNYVFAVCADDAGELWLSTGDDAAHRSKIAECQHFADNGDWNKYPAQTSRPIALKAGQKYYIELLHKEAGGGDHVSAAWQLPGGTWERPIPGFRLSPCEAADDGPTVAAKPPDQGDTAPVAPAPKNKPKKNPKKPEPAKEAPKVDAEAVAKMKEAEARRDYEEAVAEAYGLLAKNAVQPALSRLAQAKSDPKLSALKSALDRDVDLAKDMDAFSKAIVAGATKLDPKTPMELKKSDGKSIKLFGDTKTTVQSVKDGILSLAKDLGGGTATIRVAIAELTATTQWELAKAGLGSPLPREGEGLGVRGLDGDSILKLALAALAQAVSGNTDFTSKKITALLDDAAKANANAEKLRHLRERLAAWEREELAEAAFAKVEALMREKKWKEAHELLDGFGKEFGATRALKRLEPSIAQRMSELDKELNPLQPMLWASYWEVRDGKNWEKLIFSKPESKLSHDWGAGSPDPRVPADNFGIRFGGLIKIEQGGQYHFKGIADDYVTVLIDGKKVCANSEGDVDLSAGNHEIKIQYREDAGNASMHVKWKPPGAKDLKEIPAEIMFHDPRNAKQYEGQ
jgi:hypothetical protein